LEEPVEGWLVKSRGLVGFVKGCYHPLPGYILTPRVLDGMKTWRRVEAGATLTRCFDFPVHVSYPEKARFYSPVELLRRLRSCGSAICRAAVTLAEYLASAAGPDHVGVTGGLAYSPTDASDIDLVVYGLNETMEAYRALSDLRAEGRTHPYGGQGHAWSKEDVDLHEKLARERLLFGRFMGYEYNVRLVPCVVPSPCTRVVTLGEAKISGRICSSLSFTTPTHYLLCGHSGAVHIVTHRLRYTELPLGALVEVKGKRQLVCGREALTPDHGGWVRLLALPGQSER